MKRLLTIGHSYVVALNRRLPDEIARQASGRWSVTVAAPTHYHGDLRANRARESTGRNGGIAAGARRTSRDSRT